MGREGAARVGQKQARKEFKMARTAVKIVRVPKPVVIRQPLAVRGRAALMRLRRGGRRVASAAGEQKHLIGALLGAAGFGLLRRYSPGTVDTLTVAGLPPELVAGGLCFVAAKATGNRSLRHAATGLLCVGAYAMVQTVGTSGW